MNEPSPPLPSPSSIGLYEPKNQWVQGGVLFAAFVGGPLLGWLVGQLLGGVSENARTGLYLPFPVILFAGYAMWSARLKAIAFDGVGRGILVALFRLIIQRRRPERIEDILPTPQTLARMAVKAQKAASSFLVVAVPVALVTGLAALLIDAEVGALHRAAITVAACLGYGWALARLGRRGYLPILEEGG